MKRIFAGLAAVFVALSTAGCHSPVNNSENPTRTLVFTAVPSRLPGPLEESFRPILRLLEEETGRKIRFQAAPDYATVIEGVRTGQVDIAEMGPFSYVRVKRLGTQATAVAARVVEKGDIPGYYSYGITRADSPITSLAGFRGKKVCFVDKNSASGYLYPKAALLKNGISPENDLTAIFTRSHDSSVLAVSNGQCDAGFAYDSVVNHRLLEEGQLRPGEIKILWKSEEIPGGPLVINNSLPTALREKIITALQQKANADYLRSKGFCEGQCAITDGYAYGFGPVTDANYDSVRAVCEAVGEKSCVDN